MMGLSSSEKENLLLKGASLEDLMAKKEMDSQILGNLLNTKGKQLLSQLEARLGGETFRNQLRTFVKNQFYSTVNQEVFLSSLDPSATKNIPDIINKWYKSVDIPGYLIENMNNYIVIEGERERTQIKFQVTNPTLVDGMIQLSFRFRRGFIRRDQGGQNQPDDSRIILLPAKTTKDIALVLDQQPAMMTINTYVSKNIPAIITVPIRRLTKKKDTPAQEFQKEIPYQEQTQRLEEVYIVDNEDSGFEILTDKKSNWLRKLLRQLFGSETEKDEYTRFNFFNPPTEWQKTANPSFYGKMIFSGVFKKPGNGQSRVAWTADIKEDGEYEIYYYDEGFSRMMGRFRRRRDSSGQGGRQNQDQGQKYFTVNHSGGPEEVVFNLKEAEAGWNLLGTFQLSAGKNRVELTDKNSGRYVSADAIKWIKRGGS